MFFSNDELFNLMLLKASSGSGVTEDTVTGNPLTFLTDLAKPLKSLLIPFTPIQQGTGDPSPDNIRSIVPWEGLKVVHFDENLLTINRVSAQTTQGITYTPIKQGNKTVALHVEGERTANNPFFNLNYVNGQTLSVPVGSYKMYGGVPGCRFQLFYKDENGTERVAAQDYGEGVTAIVPEGSTASWLRLLVDTDEAVNLVVYPVLIEESSTYDSVSISFPSPVYGGSHEAVSGKLMDGWARVKISELDWQYQSNWNGRFRAGLQGKDGVDASVTANLMCDCYKSELGTNSNNNIICGYGKGNSGLVYIKDSRFTDKDDFVEAVGDYYIYYPLLTPQTVQLTPAQITALVGNNNLWSDANGEMTAIYYKKG